MTARRLDARTLHRVVDAHRADRGLSWRAVARELSVEPVVLRRLGAGRVPDAHALVSLLLWLGWAPELHLVALRGES